MATETIEMFRCRDCPKCFTKRMDYNRHRKKHDRPYQCSLCEKSFGLKTDLQRHRSTHRSQLSQQKFPCKVPGCNFNGTTRKDYLWKHMQKKHKSHDAGAPLTKTLRTYFDDSTKEEASNIEDRNLELLEAANQGNEEKVRDLLSRNANVSTRDAQGRTPLHLAANENHPRVVELLLDHGADVAAILFGETTALYLAVRNGHEAVVKVLLNRNAEFSKPILDESTSWHAAVVYCHEPIIKLMLEHGADVDAPSKNQGTALSIAVERATPDGTGYENIIKLLLDHGANVNMRNCFSETPLFRAAEYGLQRIAHLLLDRGADPNMTTSHARNTPLHAAAARDEEIAKALLRAKADVNAQDRWGFTPLSYAVDVARSYLCQGFNPATTKLLLGAGATVSQRDWNAMPHEFRE